MVTWNRTRLMPPSFPIAMLNRKPSLAALHSLPPYGCSGNLICRWKEFSEADHLSPLDPELP